MKKTLSFITVILITLFMLTGCGDPGTSYSTVENDSYIEANGIKDYNYNNYESNFAEPNNPYIIVTGKIHIETKDYGETYKLVSDLINENKGHFGSSYEEVQYNPATGENDGNMYGEYTVRVPKENFFSFADSISAKAKVIEKSIDSQDVSTEYTDIEGRLAVLRAERDRLLELIEQAREMSDLITLEQKLSEVNYQIENYQSSLNNYDNKIQYSTVTLIIEEVNEYTAMKSTTFVEELWSSFVKGASNVVDILQSIAIWAAYNVFGLIVLGIYIYFLIRRFKKVKYFSSGKSILFSALSIIVTALIEAPWIGFVFTFITLILVIITKADEKSRKRYAKKYEEINKNQE